MASRRSFPILLVAAFSLLLFVPRAHAAYEISDGSVKALYHFEDANDSSGNGYNLTNNGSITFTSGLLGNAASFNGSSQYFTQAGTPLSGQIYTYCTVLKTFASTDQDIIDFGNFNNWLERQPPSGQYTLYILGGTTGSYWIGAWPPQKVAGNIQAGAMDAYTLDFSPTSTGNPKLMFQGTISSTASITSELPHNLPLLAAPQPVISPPEPTFIPALPPSVSTSSISSSTIVSSTPVYAATSSEPSISSTSSSP